MHFKVNSKLSSGVCDVLGLLELNIYLGISLLQFPYEIKAVLQDIPFLMVIAEGIAFDYRIID